MRLLVRHKWYIKRSSGLTITDRVQRPEIPTAAGGRAATRRAYAYTGVMYYNIVRQTSVRDSGHRYYGLYVIYLSYLVIGTSL